MQIKNHMGNEVVEEVDSPESGGDSQGSLAPEARCKVARKDRLYSSKIKWQRSKPSSTIYVLGIETK